MAELTQLANEVARRLHKKPRPDFSAVLDEVIGPKDPKNPELCAKRKDVAALLRQRKRCRESKKSISRRTSSDST